MDVAIANADASSTPTSSSPTGTAYSTNCNSGYNASSSSGTLVCETDGSWTGKPTCHGEYECVLINNYTNLVI